MPGKPCSGIESWNTARCGFEGIWDHAYGLLAKQSANWGMAINPVSRRGQHQVRVSWWWGKSHPLPLPRCRARGAAAQLSACSARR
jgi:hypothetical protein